MTARVWISVVTGLGTNACAGEVELLRHDQHGGELRVSRPAAVSAADARLVMAKHCGGRYQPQAASGTALMPANALGFGGSVRFVCVRATRPSTTRSRPSERGSGQLVDVASTHAFDTQHSTSAISIGSTIRWPKPASAAPRLPPTAAARPARPP